MNICFVHEEYPEETNFGGIATYQKIMAEELAKQGNNVYVICRGLKKSRFYVENNVNIYRIYVRESKNQLKNYIKYRKKVSKVLFDLQRKKLIDIIEVPDWGAETVLFEKYRKVPLVVRLHTPLKVWLKYNKNNFGKITPLILNWEEKMMESANLITCCSNALKEIIVNEFNINPSCIHVTPNPVNISDFYRDENILKEKKIIFVGSIEERKGVVVLAQALNLVFEKYPNIKVELIGKDTTRNYKNMSTKELIESIIHDKFKGNISFVGQIPNKELNKYLNSARVGVFPSLFDNFPYVVLEAMTTGLQIVGSSNSGMVEMLNDKSSIYETGNYEDLAEKIIEKYNLSLKQEVNNKNINRVKKIYNPKLVCDEIIDFYKSAITSYNLESGTKEELQIVLKHVTNEEIRFFRKECGGVSNLVFKVLTKNRKYIIKKYLYNYDFDLSDELYNKYESSNLTVIRPINKNLINYNSFNYNIFEYKKDFKILKFFRINNKYLRKVLFCKRKIDKDETITGKCMKYYLFLRESLSFDGIFEKDVEYVLEMFDNMRDKEILNERYLNHGDISKSNIIVSLYKNYLIDFDEVTITTPLYDFAVIVIKNFVRNERINMRRYCSFRKVAKKYFKKYSEKDFDDMIRFYLCKILIEKFYYHQVGVIDLNSKEQLKDDYRKYLKLLKQI